MKIENIKKTPPGAAKIFLALCIFGQIVFAAADSPRERISIDQGWRFRQGDPTKVGPGSLLYDVRPNANGGDQRERLAEATEDPAQLSVAGQAVLKPWILPTGNRFIKDPAKR
jgi:beta-galactosidase